MLHHHPQIQFVNLRENNYQLINSDNIDNSPEILSKISKMNQAELAKLLEAIAYRFKEING
ncbi:hypothetical protein BMF77_pb00005 (plasmid) [Dolichospermum sp. UHCC 0315A]|jgi:hypothetical protein|uniref:hypothetical protein n=1 Tax=Dolichospermum sp. UHCC 0315A TaxID=1914871 RepID=UPI0011E89B93|nr:hypothetical protein [Dolichospermum sp. UHCC 0315A]MBO1054712.1 hypothetical protein [Dolichospermum sp. DET73]QEI44257.1 hypothetical protein BMF77_04888 [Dolichospermum sp. UHCC 0315A]QEI44403.1 hypothetical protein BMF77_pb00005 [Dolichospermum sp. UHCC 0315A]